MTIKDGYTRHIHPAGENFPKLRWVRVVADLTELRYKTIDYLMVAYDNGATGGGAGFRAYFDDIRFESGIYKLNVVNGGFENDLYGWIKAGDYDPKVSQAHHYRGYKSALLGRDPNVDGPIGRTADTYISQEVRVPTSLNLLNPKLSLAYRLGTEESCLCTDEDYVEIYLRDRTTEGLIVLLRNTANIGWTQLTYDLSSLRGHILILTVHVHQNADDEATWAYIDHVNYLTQGVYIGYGDDESWLYLDGAVHRPDNQNPTRVLPYSFSNFLADSEIDGGLAITIETWRYTHLQLGDDPDQLRMNIAPLAWAKGVNSDGNLYPICRHFVGLRSSRCLKKLASWEANPRLEFQRRRVSRGRSSSCSSSGLSGRLRWGHGQRSVSASRRRPNHGTRRRPR